MAQHWLKSAAARDLPLSKVLRLSEGQAYKWFYRARWGTGEPCCAHCGVVDAYRLIRNGKRLNRFKCRDRGCRREFTVTSNTIFAAHKLSFRKILAIIALHCHSVKDKAALQICREVGITYRSAWVWLMKLREAIAAAEREAGPLDGVVEIDGAYIGGFQRKENRREDRPDGRLVENAAPGGRQTITALRQRPLMHLQDRVFTTVTPGESEEFAYDIVATTVNRTAVVISDEHPAYAGLDELNPLFQIRHADAYGLGPGLNTNLVESFFVRVRRSVAGIHHRVCGTYLELYVTSIAWHENTRRLRFSAKLQQVLRAGIRHPQSRKFTGYWQGIYPVEPLGWPDPMLR